MRDQKKATTYAILAVICWSTVGSAFKVSLRYADFMQLTLFASLVALIFLSIYISFTGRWKSIHTTGGKELLHSALLGLLNPFLYYLVLLRAYELLPAQEAVALNYTWTLVIVLLSIPMLKQKIKWLSIMALMISFAGTLIVVTKGSLSGFNFSNPLGTTLALGSAFLWALFWIFNVRDKRDEISKLFFNFLFGFFYLLIINLLFSNFHIPGIKGLAGMCYIGLFEMGITFVIWLKALQYSHTTAKVTNLILLSPFLSLLIVHFVVGEAIMLSTVAGLSLIIGGILLQNLKSQK